MTVIVSKKKVDVPEGFLAYLGSDGYVWAAPRRGVRGTKHKIGTEHISRADHTMYFVKDGNVCAMKR